MRDPRAGFTLIELLVVIGIISLLAAAFLPDILGARRSADKAADRANLRQQYQWALDYRNKYKTWPRGSGHKFVLDPWVRRTIDRTEQNFRRFWTPGLEANDPRFLELSELVREDPTQVWANRDELISEDTHYAGPSREVRQQRKRLDDGNRAIMANDNEFGPAFTDHTIHVLMGDGSVKELLLDRDLVPLGFTGDDEEWMPVGPESPHPLLQGLEK